MDLCSCEQTIFCKCTKRLSSTYPRFLWQVLSQSGLQGYALTVCLSGFLLSCRKKTRQWITPDRRPNVTANESRWHHLLQRRLTNLCEVICFLYFLLRSSFEPGWCVFINPSRRARTMRRGECRSCECQINDVFMLPWFIQAARQPLGSDFMTLNKNSHAWVNVQYGSICPEGPPLWLPVGVAKIRLKKMIKDQVKIDITIKEFLIPCSKWTTITLSMTLTLLHSACQPSICPDDPSLHPALALHCPSASSYRWSQEYLWTYSTRTLKAMTLMETTRKKKTILRHNAFAVNCLKCSLTTAAFYFVELLH